MTIKISGNCLSEIRGAVVVCLLIDLLNGRRRGIGWGGELLGPINRQFTMDVVLVLQMLRMQISESAV